MPQKRKIKDAHKYRDKNHLLVLDERDLLISDLWRQGYSYLEICAYLLEHKQDKVEISQVSQSIKRTRRLHREERLDFYEERLDRVIEQYYRTYREACIAWEKSKQPEVTDTYKVESKESGNDLHTKEGIEAERKLVSQIVKSSCGNPNYLDKMLRSLDSIARILMGPEEKRETTIIQPIQIIEVNRVTRQEIEQKALEDRS